MFGRLAKGGTVKVDLAGDALTFSYSDVAPKKPKPTDGGAAPDDQGPSGGGKKEPALVE